MVVVCVGQSSSSTLYSSNHITMELELCTGKEQSLPQAEAQDCPDDRIHPLAGLFKHLFIQAVIFFPLETKQVQPN